MKNEAAVELGRRGGRATDTRAAIDVGPGLDVVAYNYIRELEAAIREIDIEALDEMYRKTFAGSPEAHALMAVRRVYRKVVRDA